MKNPRILHLRASNFFGGPEKQILHHAIDIGARGFEPWIGSFLDQPQTPEILRVARDHGLPTYESRPAGRFDPRAIFELSAFLKREQIQLLCTHGFKANTVGALAKTLAGVPQIAFCRGWTAETPRVRAYEFLERRLLPLADRVACVSAAQAKVLSWSARDRHRITIVHNAVLEAPARSSPDRATAKERLGFSRHVQLIGAVGRLSAEKGQAYLVDAALRLSREFRDIKIVLLGEGRERAALASQIERLGLQHVVELRGFEKNILSWLQALDVLANCSFTEGIPNAVLEALCAGTPVVATAVGGVPELIEHAKTGLLVPAADSAALAAAIAKLLRDPQLSDALARNAHEFVHDRFSPSRQRDSLIALYRDVLGLDALPPPLVYGSLPNPALSLPSPDPQGHALPFLSVVIPVRNEQMRIGALLRQLETQNYPQDRFEILVVDGNSTDGTAGMVEAFVEDSPVPVILLANPAQLSSAGRNVGARHARGQYVIFIDGHCQVPGPTLLHDAAVLFERTNADCLCRPQPLTVPDNTGFQQVVAHARATVLGHGRDSTIYTTGFSGFCDPCSSGALYRRTVFDRVGFYDETFDACEDVEFNYRVRTAGLSSYFSPRLQVLYQPRLNLLGLWRQMHRYGRGRLRLAGKHPRAFSISQAVPAGLLIFVLFGGLISMLSTQFSRCYIGGLFVYLLVILGFSVALGVRYGLRHLSLAPLVYLVIHLGLGTGFLSELLMRLSGTRSGRGTAVRSGGSFPKPAGVARFSASKPVQHPEAS
jgi:glycosyltransferase involved in cell wall biosynthesis